MKSENLCKRLALGAVAGGVATLLLQLIRAADQKVLPDAEAPIQQDPGKFIVEKAEQLLPPQAREKIPKKAENFIAKWLGMAYGITFGSLYAATRPAGGRPLLDGASLGLGSWAVGFLGWLPATRLMPPVWKHRPKQIAKPIAEHAAYGIAAVTAYNWLRRRFA